jgi:hypothetical protein
MKPIQKNLLQALFVLESDPLSRTELEKACQILGDNWTCQELVCELYQAGLVDSSPTWVWTDNGVKLKEQITKLGDRMDYIKWDFDESLRVVKPD